MNDFNRISTEATHVLYEIIAHESEGNYWENRFENLSLREDTILRGCFKELSDNNMVSVTWADDCPYYIQVLKDGYLYEQHLEEHKSVVERSLMSPYFDVFISHANKDKSEFVDELNDSLKKLGVTIFYDKESLEWGDNWKNSILSGTQKAEFAIIVISENFFDREWTEKELNELLSRQNRNGQKIILPIIHNITVQQLSQKYPAVADIQAIDSGKYSCDEIALLFAKQLIKRYKIQSFDAKK